MNRVGGGGTVFKNGENHPAQALSEKSQSEWVDLVRKSMTWDKFWSQQFRFHAQNK